jgi:hypothetical protein
MYLVETNMIIALAAGVAVVVVVVLLALAVSRRKKPESRENVSPLSEYYSQVAQERRAARFELAQRLREHLDNDPDAPDAVREQLAALEEEMRFFGELPSLKKAKTSNVKKGEMLTLEPAREDGPVVTLQGQEYQHDDPNAQTQEFFLPTQPVQQPPAPVNEPVFVPEPVNEPVLVPEPVNEPVFVPEPAPVYEPVFVPEPAPEPAKRKKSRKVANEASNTDVTTSAKSAAEAMRSVHVDTQVSGEPPKVSTPKIDVEHVNIANSSPDAVRYVAPQILNVEDLGIPEDLPPRLTA